MPLIKGAVRDDAGTPANRTVRVYRRDAGVLIGATDSAGGPEIEADAHYAAVSTLVRFYGPSGATLLTDDKENAWKFLGNAQLSTAKKLHGVSSAYFDGAGDSVKNTGGNLGNFGTADFTVEIIFSPVDGGLGSAWSRIMETRAYPDSGGWAITCVELMNPSQVRFYESNGKSFLTTLLPVSNGEWHHLCVSRKDGILRLFLDGVVQMSAANSSNFLASDLSIGGNVNNGDSFKGYVDSIRLTKGFARYTENFTPPTSEFLRGEGIPARAFGEYALRVPYSGEVQVICLHDDVGPLQNDLVLRTFPV